MILDLHGKTGLLYGSFSRLFAEVIPAVCRHFSAYAFVHEPDYCTKLHALIVVIVYSSCRSHVCFDKNQDPFETDETVTADDILLSQAGLLLALAREGAAEAEAGRYRTVDTAGRTAPVIAHNGKFYLNKFFHYEHASAAFIGHRVQEDTGIDRELLAESAGVLFPGGGDGGQYSAAVTAASRRFSVIAGGPGTGKTTTVCKVLLLRIQQAVQRGKDCRILMLAPTGKAASRLKESVRSGIQAMVTSGLLSGELASYVKQIPEDVYTVHRALYPVKNGGILPYNLVVLDESSMIDLSLFHRLVSHCADDVSMILLGDGNQLSSVQAGSVLSDITGSVGEVTSCCTYLTRSYRFDPQGGIGKAASLIVQSQGAELLDFLHSGDPDVRLVERRAGAAGLTDDIREAIDFAAGSFGEYARYAKTGGHGESVALFHRFALLAALREGPFGVSQLNVSIERLLAAEKAVSPSGRLYENMPLLITKNSYLLDVYNGDTGVLRKINGRLRCCILQEEGKPFRTINPVMLESYEKAYAMTIHKSQGSEFDGVVVVLPDRPVPLLTRELLYTAVTRARKRVAVIATRETVLYAAERRTSRMSGLAGLLTATEGV
ncbi:MAG: exodeoxyribonuclease V subunit alpha [Spirochaetota bacterium]